MTNEEFAELLFPDIKHTPDYYEEKYPQRDLPDKAEVTRIGPSPTGFIHLGNLYSAMAGERLAHRSGGVFYLRIEDTDNKRKVEGAVESVISSLDYFNIQFDEGAEVDRQAGKVNYGPFYQRQRAEIYQTYVKDLVKRGLAYPCFCSEEELNAIRNEQSEEKVNDIGYYGKYAKCRNLSMEEAAERIKNGEPYSMRLRSQGIPGNTFKFKDEIMGEVSLPENIMDVVILKSDGIPTYHFAHAVDDHLMRTTTVIRGCEWLPSVPIHVELFNVLGFRRPKYAHTAQLMKIEDGKKRKLSKRKDPELSLGYYRELGYHPEAVRVYLLTILNSNFEEWYQKNPGVPIEEFKFSLNKMGVSGILFDLQKLDDISSNIISAKDREEVYEYFLKWMKQYKPESVPVYFGDPDKMGRIMDLCMGVGQKRRRKDFINCSQMFDFLSYFFDDIFTPEYEFGKYENMTEIIAEFKNTYDPNDDNQTWFNKLKAVADKFGYASDMKAYKAEPDKYKGNVSHIAEIIRVAVTGRKNTPDLWTIMQILGNDSCMKRLDKASEFLGR
ncbi:glutamate--tRNA ligase [Ruminococcus sp. HUN007]|uniref:glutamate--tRNA ligase n=1 Tax=Ruminococcus sp. HUN007 TaxID=1514668 RepID=UPI0005D20443|nr:glutamate--tRNA ligase [Ruminococcus sp. HUN007]